MKNKYLKSKTITLLLFLSFIFSCSDNDSAIDLEEEIIETGSLASSIKLNDKYGEENLIHDDTEIEIIDANKKSIIINPSSNGNINAEKIPIGAVLINISKSGYIGRDSISYIQTINTVTLPQIELLEALPFSFKTNSFNYVNGMIEWNNTIEYMTDENFPVSNLFCFSKNSDVSINNNDLIYVPGGDTNVNFINSTISNSVTYNIDNFLSAGFQSGDTIYVNNYAVVGKFGQVNYTQGLSFDKLTYKMNNTSNITSFTLP